MGSDKLSSHRCSELADHLEKFLEVYYMTVIVSAGDDAEYDWGDGESVKIPKKCSCLRNDVMKVQKAIERLNKGTSKKVVKPDRIDQCIRELGDREGRGY